jgi:CBS domain-containing protein
VSFVRFSEIAWMTSRVWAARMRRSATSVESWLVSGPGAKRVCYHGGWVPTLRLRDRGALQQQTRCGDADGHRVAKDGQTGELFILQARLKRSMHAGRSSSSNSVDCGAAGRMLVKGRNVGSKIAAGPVRVIPNARPRTRAGDRRRSNDPPSPHVSTGRDVHAVLGTMMMFKVRRVPVVSDTVDVEGMISIDDIILRGTPPAGVSQDALIAASRSICGARSAAIHEVADS